MHHNIIKTVYTKSTNTVTESRKTENITPIISKTQVSIISSFIQQSVRSSS